MLRKKGPDSGEAGRLSDSPVFGGPTDPISGLPSRTNLFPWLQEGLTSARSTSQRMALLIVEIGYLRDVNDTYGPDVGDELVREVARRISAYSGGARVLRYSGADFVVIAESVGSIAAAEEIAAGIFEGLVAPFVIGTSSLSVASYIGGALSDDGYPSIEDWVEDTRNALAEARRMGTRSVVVHDESTRNRADIRVTEARIQRAFENEEFRVVYQPIVTLNNGRVVGTEALLRWQDPGTSAALIPPSQFLSMLEKSGLITPIGTWVLAEACRQTQQWNASFPERTPLFVAVNLGARQMAQTTFAESVANALDACGLAPELLSLDITEEALRYNKSATWGEVRDLKYLGVRLALDDFGVGESTTSYLRELSLDYLRIHKMFVDGVVETREDLAIVTNMIRLATDLGLTTIAEGVESADQAAKLLELDCGLAQGYHFGRPETAADFEALITPT